MNERRRKIVYISPDFLKAFFTKDKPMYIQCQEGLPDNAQFIAHDYDPQRDLHYLIFHSDDWEPVEFGMSLPTLTPLFGKFEVVTLLQRAEEMLSRAYGTDADQWLQEWRAIKDRLVE